MSEGTLRILHLSDLHYGMEEGNTRHYFTSNGKPDARRLIELLQADSELSDAPPDLVIVSGDVGWSGMTDDYAFAKDFFVALRHLWNRATFVVAPGNHDVDRKATNSLDRQKAFLEFMKDFHGSTFETTYPFLSSRDLPTPREGIVAVLATDAALVVAVNSAAFLDEKGVPVFISQQLLESLERHINAKYQDSARLRIFVLHHHLLPFVENAWGPDFDFRKPPQEMDRTIVANSAHLQSWLSSNNFSLVLHGHKHKPHGRRDLLWRGEDSATGREVFIAGAGTTGVYRDEIPPGLGLSYNVIVATKLDHDRFYLQTFVRKLLPEEASRRNRVQTYYHYEGELGRKSPVQPHFFCANRMDDCHRAIAAAYGQRSGESDADFRERQRIRNFISVVEAPEFHLPATTVLQGTRAERTHIERAFHSLHPEFDSNRQWDSREEVLERIKKLRSNLRYMHGPRLFSLPGLPDVLQRSGVNPISWALENISRDPTRAYVGLFSPEVDVSNQGDPLPSLVGIQFIEDDGSLDLVATFRIVELSFWWVVNMFEMIELLKWSAREKGRQARRITFFAPLAGWNANTPASLPAKIDDLKLSDLALLVGDAMSSDKLAKSAQARLIDYLEDKARNTSAGNLEPKVVGDLAQLFTLHPQVKDAHQALQAAVNLIDQVLREPTMRRSNAERVRKSVEDATAHLRNYWSKA